MCATLARPEKKNALTGAMYQRARRRFRRSRSDETVGAVLLARQGRAYSPPATTSAIFWRRRAGRREARAGTVFIKALAAFEKPLVAAVEGPAIGIGTTLCFHCDLVYAAPSARFQMPFVNLGLVPEAGSSLLAAQRFGAARAAEFIMLAESFDAAAARELGLVNAIVEPGELYAHALAKAQALAAKPRDALMATRRLMRGDPRPLKARMDEELRLFGEAVRSPEARAAFTAFMEKAKS